MAELGQKHAPDELERLRAALESETQLRLEAEKRLREVNSDFRQFVAVLSHDLREPLRAIGAYCEILSGRFPTTPDPEADKFLQFILEAVDRIQAMLTDLVEYTAGGSESRNLAPLDLNAVFMEATTRIAREPGEREAMLTHSALPEVLGNFDALVKVMRHLLENAIKFNHRPDPRVHVSSKREGEEWLISVKDNGPGIDPPHQEGIFGLFKRLHGKEYPGAGIGLAFCKKTIESHGGRIWVESTPGQGSTFHFTLPAWEEV